MPANEIPIRSNRSQRDVSRRKNSVHHVFVRCLPGLLMWLAWRGAPTTAAELKTGKAAMGPWTEDVPGLQRKITVEDLPAPYATKSEPGAQSVVARPANAWPAAPEGFKVELFATGLKQPRVIITAPNGDLFVAESGGNQIRVLRDVNGDGRPEVNEVFATGLDQPFGLAFYPLGPDPQFLYVGNTGNIVRLPYHSGDLKAAGPVAKIASVSPGGHLTGGGHWTRDLAFSRDGSSLFVSIGSLSNASDDEEEKDRARIFQFDPDGGNRRVYASGLRNPVGLAIDPATGALWTSVNERDGLGDDLPPDYITKVKEGGFYGWPWFYTGNHPEPSLPANHPELGSKVIVPDVLLQAHSASLDLTFYDGTQFPAHFHGGIFASEHGSWNRTLRTGYKVIFVPVKEGVAEGGYEDFVIGFATRDGKVWGRPVGVTVGQRGELFITDDGSNSVWRVTYPAATDKSP